MKTKIVYAVVSDEISLLFHPDEDTFGRKVRKYNSLLAGVASAAFSMQLGQQAIFDCRMVPLPTVERVQDYFLWRQEDAHRNSLNSHCYWALRKDGVSAKDAQKRMSGITNGDKNEILFELGINFNDLPSWQKRGVGLYFHEEKRKGFNPKTKEATLFSRNVLGVDYELPLGQDYASFISKILKDNQETSRK